ESFENPQTPKQSDHERSTTESAPADARQIPPAPAKSHSDTSACPRTSSAAHSQSGYAAHILYPLQAQLAESPDRAKSKSANHPARHGPSAACCTDSPAQYSNACPHPGPATV